MALPWSCVVSRRLAGLGACVVAQNSIPKFRATYTAEISSSSGQRLQTKMYDVLVIGGGVVGLAVARECSVRGASVALVEKSPWLAAGASSGNSGLGCTGYDAPVGSLERRLLRRSIQLHQNLYRSFGLNYNHVRKSGSLVVAWNQEELAKLAAVLEENREAGDHEARFLTAAELKELEPGVGEHALGAVLCPREAVVEPWLVPMGYAESARLHGAELHVDSRVVAVEQFDLLPSGGTGKAWAVTVQCMTPEHASLVTPGRSRGDALLTNPPAPFPMPCAARIFHARVVINCAGLYGDHVEQLRLCSSGVDTTNNKMLSSSPFTVTPRKGQFVVFKPPEEHVHGPPPSHIIEPVATEFTKGVIAWTSVYGDIIVGPTAEPQTDREDRSTTPEVIASLRAFGEMAVPAVRDAAVVGTYSGLRPATEFRDYQIVARPESMWITVGGIRSTGLTASSGIAEYVSDLYEKVAAGASTRDLNMGSNDEASLVGVTAAANTPSPLRNVPMWKHNGPVPTLEELAVDYQERGDGCVMLYGRPQKVTHPISSFGMESYIRSLATS